MYSSLRKEITAAHRILQKSQVDPSTVLKELNSRAAAALSVSSRHFFSTSSVRSQNSSRDNDDKEQDSDKDGNQQPHPMAWLVFFASAFLMAFLANRGNSNPNQTVLSWNEFIQDFLSKGEVERIKIREDAQKVYVILQPGAIIRGHPVSRHETITVNVSNLDAFEVKVREAERQLGISTQQSIPVEYLKKNEVAEGIVTLIIMFAIWRLIRRGVKSIGSMETPFSNIKKASFIRGDRIKDGSGKAINFNDVAGLHEAKVELMEFVDFLQRPQKYKDLGGSIPKGALLLGPPGCGKTLLAKAIASEANVPFLAMAGSEFVEMIGGKS